MKGKSDVTDRPNNTATNVVEFSAGNVADHKALRQQQTKSDLDQQTKKMVEDAYVMAKCVSLDALSYERERIQTTKHLKVRVTFLDAMRSRIQERVFSYQIKHKCDDSRVGKYISFCRGDPPDPSRRVGAWCLASGVDNRREFNLLLLADGNATVQEGRPIE
jgi:hypothetical protein